MSIVNLIVEFGTGKVHALGVHDDYKITCVEVRRKIRLVFAAENTRNFGGQTAEHLVGGVHYHPLARNLTLFWYIRSHLHFHKPPRAQGNKTLPKRNPPVKAF